MQMKTILMMACLFLSASLCEADLGKNARGKTVCIDGQSGAAYNANTGKGQLPTKLEWGNDHSNHMDHSNHRGREQE